MSDDFEDRVRDAAGQLIDVRYERLVKLDQRLADIYLVKVRRGNAKAPRRARTGADAVGDGPKKNSSMMMGFGKISRADVDAIMRVALDGGRITKEEEEALLIILEGQRQWEPGAQDYMANLIENNMKHLWSTRRIDANQAASLLKPTDTIDFFSRGDRHQGTGLHYRPGDFQVIAGLIRDKQIGAWEVSAKRSFLRTSAAKDGATGFYASKQGPVTLEILDQHYTREEWLSGTELRSHADDIYVASGLKGKERQITFAHEATHALQDWENVRALTKFIEADAHIVESFTALKLGMRFPADGDTPQAVAFRAAAPLLEKPVSRRNDRWRSAFRKAYDQVVDAFVDHAGKKDADKRIDYAAEEAKRRQKEEKDLLRKMRRALRGKRRP
jgi:hypothetical protein